MRIAYIAAWFPANFNLFLSRAFESLGHTVDRFGPTFPNHYGVRWGEDERYFETVKPLPTTSTYNELSRQYPYCEAGFNPNAYLNMMDYEEYDLVFLADWPELAITDFDRTNKLALYEAEGWSWCWKRKDLLKPDVAYTPMPRGVRDDRYDKNDWSRSALEDGWKYLPGAWNPERQPMSFMHERKFDFCLMAGMYGFRPDLMKHLISNGLSVAAGQTDIDGYAVIHQDSLTTVECSEGQDFIKWRMFEAMGMGCIVLATHCDLFDDCGFEPEVHYIPVKIQMVDEKTGHHYPKFNSVENGIHALRANPDIAAEIRKNAYELVRDRHTYRHRAEQVIREVGL